MNDDLIWVEKYRPKTVSECILPDRLKKPFLNFVKQGSMPHLLLYGGAGTGKTTIARALCNDLDMEVTMINASKDRNLSLIDKISIIASTVSMDGKQKAIILDESDNLNPSSAQPALRATMEEFPNIRFILTANYPNKLMDPIRSRCSPIGFNILAEEKEEMILKFLSRVFQILKGEGVKFDQKAVAEIVKRNYPDNRKILNILQKYATGGEISAEILKHLENADVTALLGFIKDRNLGACRQWVADNSDTDVGQLYMDIYEKSYGELANADSVLNMIQMVADYQDKATRAINQDINTMALIAGMISQLEFKS